MHDCSHARSELLCVTLSTEPAVRGSASQNTNKKPQKYWDLLFGSQLWTSYENNPRSKFKTIMLRLK